MEVKSKDMDEDEKRIKQLLERKGGGDDDIDEEAAEKLLKAMDDMEEAQKAAAKRLWKKTLNPKLREVFVR